MKLHYNTVSATLDAYLRRIMAEKAFERFYLVGGTALSLQLGHRMSVDIDLFTSIPYATMDCELIVDTLQRIFPHISGISCFDTDQMVYTVYVGDNRDAEIKLDICYDEDLIFPVVDVDGIRMACDKEIAAMKMLAIVTGSRRKDFWDIHELMNRYALDDMIEMALKRYPYTLTRADIMHALLRVWDIDDVTDIISLKGGYWEFVADDIYEECKKLDNYGCDHTSA